MGQIVGLDHVGIAVRDLDEAIETFSRLLGENAERHRIDSGHEYNDDGTLVEELRFAYLDAGNGVHIELLEPGEVGVGAVGGFVEEFGEGIHHVSFWVSPKSEFASFFDALSDMGFATVGDEPWCSDPDADRDNVYTYIHPDSCHGTLVELITPYSFEDGEMRSVETPSDAGRNWPTD